ncbi:Ascofuranone/ascochlorin biosynthesis clusters transcription regulator [Podospora australis]|uniref:Ascofuranone/ascochlorin biosynthesis clusters transcription regulator n=1 Tax=Podospora australis TaxID=1536484 RepID=A0AAN6WNZ9_9PEZI|nr:Ascofuranone/ascochlorin biosynthesis clusters transcription regulator [Podospora australis]
MAGYNIAASSQPADSEQPLRHACDRCHSQKLRCPRSIDPEKATANPDEPCSRCRKAGMPCIVSLRGKAGRPSKISKKKSVSNAKPSTSSTSTRAFRTQEREFPTPVFNAPNPLDRAADMVKSWGQDAEDRLAGVLGLESTSPIAMPSPRMFDDMLDMDKTPPVSRSSGGRGPFDGMAPGGGMASTNHYEPFLMDFDPTSLDLPDFYMNDLTNPLSHPQPTVHTISLQALQKNIPIDPPRPGPFDQIPSPPPSSSQTPPLFSSTECYRKLSDLNARILPSLARANSSSSAQILKDVVGFCGELIDTARKSMPHFSASSQSNTPSCSRRASTATDMSLDSAYCSLSGNMSRRPSHDKLDDFGMMDQSVPESAVIFLLLGCYTQILRLFEVTTNCLWQQHCDSSSSSSTSTTPTPTMPPSTLGMMDMSMMMMLTDSDSPSASIETGMQAVGPLLEASLAVHTVTYLLSRLNRALTVPESGDPTFHAGSGSWERSFLGGKELDDGLLGRAFGEIREREQWLMRRTQLLQQRINKCHI